MDLAIDIYAYEIRSKKMKKLLILLPLVALIAGCVTIDERYAEPRVMVAPADECL